MRPLFPALLVLLSPVVAAAEEAVLLKVPSLANVGEKVRITARTKQNQTVLVSGLDGEALHQEKRVIDRTATYVQETLAREAGKKATKLAVTFEKAQQTTGDQPLNLKLDGKTVLIDHQNPEQTYKLPDGGELTADALEYLKDAFKRDRDADDRFEMAMFPKRPVKVGETWEGDYEEIARQLSGTDSPLKLDLKRSKATAKLLKTYEKAGRPFAVVEVSMDMAMTEMGNDERRIKLDANSRFKANGTIDLSIDGGPEQGTLTMKLTIIANGKISTPDDMELGVKFHFTSEDTKMGERLTR